VRSGLTWEMLTDGRDDLHHRDGPSDSSQHEETNEQRTPGGGEEGIQKGENLTWKYIPFVWKSLDVSDDVTGTSHKCANNAIHDHGGVYCGWSAVLERVISNLMRRISAGI